MGIANDMSAFAATVVRLGRGLYPKVTAEQRPGPDEQLELYDFEGCPYCRKVREVLCELDLDYLAHPVAHGSPRRSELVQQGGKMQVPYLIDPNTGTGLYESDGIIEYLNDTYGAGRRAGWALPIPSLVDNLDSAIASAVRLARGTRSRITTPRAARLKPLTLFNMEGSPYCRKVRECLSELDLEHLVRNLPKGSPKRAELVKRGGKMQVPYLIDPNTGKELYESDDIVTYLELQYGQGTAAHKARKPGNLVRPARASAGTAPAG
ncbi:MAG: glutathione S-transferase N-terminal domain-containing protein [Deltaproteobacteria bacterium]|nr:glutathione S-transferase N-terminal domain-containing protein [Deltaproteobacteria bacterium]